MSARAAFSYLTISAVETYGFLSRAHTRVRPYDLVILYPVKTTFRLFLQSGASSAPGRPMVAPTMLYHLKIHLLQQTINHLIVGGKGGFFGVFLHSLYHTRKTADNFFIYNL